MKIAYASSGDFSLKPYVHYLYAKHEHPNTPLYVYDDKSNKVSTKEEIEKIFKDAGVDIHRKEPIVFSFVMNCD